MYRLTIYHFPLILSLAAAVRSVTMKEFELVSAKRGAPLRCGVTCGQDPLCTGYMSTPGSQHDCTTLTDGTLPGECFAAASDSSGKVCYGLKIDQAPPTTVEATPEETTALETTRLETTPVPIPETTPIPVLATTPMPSTEPPASHCVESARESGGSGVYMSYFGSDTLVRYDSPADCETSNVGAMRTKSKSVYYAGFPEDLMDMYTVDVGASLHLMVFDGSGMVRLYKINFDKTGLDLVTGTTMKVQDEYGLMVPALVHAADLDRVELMVYLVNGDDVYELHMDSPPYSATYTFKSQFTLLEPGNPFCCESLSGELPQRIHALLVYTGEVLAFAGDDVFHLDRTSATWTKQSSVYCP